MVKTKLWLIILEIVILSTLTNAYCKAQDFKQSKGKYYNIFGNDYKSALIFFKKNKELIKSTFKKYNIESEIIISALFPERIRYSIVQDFFETEALSTIYVSYGSTYVDFSIGEFQIKPSFVEKLEEYIKTSSKLQDKYLHLFPKTRDVKKKRKNIVSNLKSLKYQLFYISVFYDILIEKFDLLSMNKTKKINFTASAYNYGFHNTKQEISDNFKSKYFPYGTKYPGKQYSYTNIALDFNQNYYNSIFNISKYEKK